MAAPQVPDPVHLNAIQAAVPAVVPAVAPAINPVPAQPQPQAPEDQANEVNVSSCVIWDPVLVLVRLAVYLFFRTRRIYVEFGFTHYSCHLFSAKRYLKIHPFASLGGCLLSFSGFHYRLSKFLH